MVAIIIGGPQKATKEELVHDLYSGIKVLSSHRLLQRENVEEDVSGVSDENVTYRQNNDDIDRIKQIFQSALMASKCIEDNTISKCCAIDTLVLAHCYVGESFIHTLEKAYRDQFEFAVTKYRDSLTILLTPPTPSRAHASVPYEDNFQSVEATTFIETYRFYFQRYRIPFLLISSDKKESRLNIIKNALSKHSPSLPLETSTLRFYSTKRDPIAPEYHSDFAFYVDSVKYKDRICIPTINIKEHIYEQTWTVYEKGEINRFIHKHGAEKLVLLAFDINVKAKVVQRMLKNGISVKGEMYTFLGCSSSGMKERKCFMWRGNKKETALILQSNGNFEKISQISKRMARIGLLFSGVKLTSVEVPTKYVVLKDDIEISTKEGVQYCFTDGCGGIGYRLARRINAEVKDESVHPDYLPSVYQIRYQGFKGVVTLDPGLCQDSLMLRPSMKKFETNAHPNIGVCKVSRPFTYGHLNRQFIMLLSGLRISDETFLSKQKEYLEILMSMTSDMQNTVKVMQWQNKFDSVIPLIESESASGSTKYRESIEQQILKIQRNLMSKDIEKLRILIPKSRNIFGVCDPYNILEYGECFLNITHGNVGKPKMVAGQVVVCKNPCYLLGDVRVLTAVDSSVKPDVKTLSHLVDCIVFPTKGKRPHSVEIAGSDLDGDEYFVTWDEELIPKCQREPYTYPAASSKVHELKNADGFDSMVSYFSKQNETKKLVGRVDTLFKLWADRHGVTSYQCDMLGRLFGNVIDAAKSGESVAIPRDLVPSDDEGYNQETFVWQRMINEARKSKEKYVSRVVDEDENHGSAVKTLNVEFVHDIVCEEISCISDFDKFQLALKYFGDVNTLMENYIDYFDFSAFTSFEKFQAFEAGIPTNILKNALTKSNILTTKEINWFGLNTSVDRWIYFFRSQQEDLNWGHLVKVLTECQDTLLVISLPDDVVILLRFLTAQSNGTGSEIFPGTVVSHFISRRYNYKYSYVLGSNYSVDLTHETIQLYRNGLKQQTFLWLNSSSYKAYSNRGVERKNKVDLCDDNVNAVSADLTSYSSTILRNLRRRHPLVNKIPIVQLEVFVCARGKDEPYFDIHDANDLLPVQETVFEEDDDIEDEFDVKGFMTYEEVTSLLNEEDFRCLLERSLVDVKLLQFQLLVNTWSESNTVYPTFVQTYTVVLFEKIFNILSNAVIPEDARDILHGVAVHGHMTDAVCRLELLSILCKLGMRDTACTVCDNSEEYDLTICMFLELAKKWNLWWTIDVVLARKFLSKCKNGFTPYTSLGNEDFTAEAVSTSSETRNKLDISVEKEDTTDTNLDEVSRYVMHYGMLQIADFIEESHSLKLRLAIKKRFLFGITNLKFMKCENRDTDTFTMYNNIGLERNPGISVGQYVGICKQKDFVDFRDTALIYCVAQVVAFRLAPVTITLRLIGKPTQSIIRCTDPSQTFTKIWTVFPIVNVTLHMRIIDALIELQTSVTESKKKKLSKDIVSILSDPFGHPLDSPLHEPRGYFEVSYNDSGIYMDQEMFDEICLNDAQKNAIRKSVEQNFTLIQGPPGTGKTTVISRIVQTLLSIRSNEKVLVVAETNNAVDNIVLKLKDRLPFEILRTGNEVGMNSAIWDVTLDAHMRKLEEKEAKKTTYKDSQGLEKRKTELVKKLINNARVILTTCAGSGDPILKSSTFETVLVDEATQTKETVLLCAMVHCTKRLVLVGDPQQLGPVISETSYDDNIPSVKLLSKTLFHRIYDKIASDCLFLNKQHRMHPDLMRFPSSEFYDGKLISAVTKEMRNPIRFPWPVKGRPFCFINTIGKERRIGTSFCNSSEVDVIQTVICRLLNDDETNCRVRDESEKFGMDMTQITILTTYQGQVSELQRSIKPQVMVRSVDSFQGRENECIIVSTVRANDSGTLGFVDDRNRINVLLTRAKRGLIVVGNRETLIHSKVWSKWLKDAPHLQIEVLNEDPVVNFERNTSELIRRGENRPYRSRGRGRGSISSRQDGRDVEDTSAQNRMRYRRGSGNRGSGYRGRGTRGDHNK